MDDIFSGLAARVDDVIGEVSALAVEAGVPAAIYKPIASGVKKRAGLLQ